MKTKKGLVVFLFSIIILVGFLGGVSAVITSITVTSPNGGENWKGTKNIQWTAVGTSGDLVDILWSSGAGWNYITSGVPYNIGSYEWDTTHVNDGINYYIKIKDESNPSKNDISNNQFIIDNTPPTIIDDYANDGDWVNSAQTITLNPTDAVSGVDIVKHCEGVGCDLENGNILSAPYQLNYITTTNTILRYGVRDKAGNPSEIGEVNVKIDLNKPTTISIGGKPEGLIVSQAGVTASVSECVDEETGCNASTYAFKQYDAEPETCSNNYSIYTDGSLVTGHKWVCAAAKDNVGNTGFSNLTEFTIYDTIQSAVDDAIDGDTINVGAGTFAESVNVNKDLTISGANVDTTIISPGAGDYGFKITSDGVTISNLQIQSQFVLDDTDDTGVMILNSDNVKISNNKIISTSGTDADGREGSLGIWICGTDSGCAGSNNLTIENNTITINGVSTAVYTEQVNSGHSGWQIKSNTITADSGVTLELYDVTNSEVSGNNLDSSTTNSNVIWSSECADITNLIFNNNIVRDSSGSMVAFLADFSNLGATCSSDTSVNSVTATGNTFSDWDSKAVRVGVRVTNVAINQNKFLIASQTQTLKNEDAASVNAENNWWGFTTDTEISELISANVDYTPWAYGYNEETEEVLIDNESPTIVLDDANVNESLSIELDASASYDNGNAGIQTYEWDLDNDGTYENEGQTAIFDASMRDGPDSQIIGIRLTDNSGNIAEKTITITINNVAPTINSITPSDETYAVAEENIQFNADATDIPADILDYLWDFGDGSPISELQNPIYSYSNGGIYTVTLTVTDDDGASVSDSSIQIYVNDLFWDLSSDWNLVSSPKVVSQNMAGLFGTIWGYNNGWIENPITIEPGKGYWIESQANFGLDYNSDCTFPQCLPSGKINIDALNSGWNLIGLTSDEELWVDEAFGSMIYDDTHLPVYYVIEYDEEANQFVYLYGWDTMTPGEGYWVYKMN